MSKQTVNFLLALSVVANAVLIYRIFDLGVTLTHQSSALERREGQLSDINKVLTMVAPQIGKDEFVKRAKSAGLDILVKDENKAAYVGEVQFIFKENRIVGISYK